MVQNRLLKKNRRIPNPPLGWPLLPVPDAENGTLSYPTLENSIKQFIRVVLLTRPGEQLMRPRFGAGLSQYLHQPNTLETRRQIQDTVLDGLSKWEQRIVVDGVEIWDDDKEPDKISIEITYRVRRTGEQATTNVKLNIGS